MSNDADGMDDQDIAEGMDDDLIGRGDAVTSDEVVVDFPPERPMGLPFADADVTDEGVAERILQEEPEVTAADIFEPGDLARDIAGVDDVDEAAVANEILMDQLDIDEADVEDAFRRDADA